MKSNWYMDPEELADAVEECQAAGNLPTEKACCMFRTLAEHLTGSPRYSRYGTHDKADMVSAALEKMIRNIKNYKPQYRKSAFSYFTRCCEQGFMAYLIKHYKFINRRRDAALAMAERIEQQCPEAAQMLREQYPAPGPAVVPGRGRKKRRARPKKENERPGASRM